MEKYLVGLRSELYEMLPIVLDHLRKKKFEDHFDLSSFYDLSISPLANLNEYNSYETLRIGLKVGTSVTTGRIEKIRK